MKLISFTRARTSGIPVYVNPKRVTHVAPAQDTNTTLIYFAGYNAVEVVESLVQVLAALRA